MFLQKIKDITVHKFIIKETDDSDTGLIFNLCLGIVNGNTIWKGKTYRIVLPLELLAFSSFFLTLTVFANYILHPEKVNWFKSILDLSFILGELIMSVEIFLNGDNLKELSRTLDKWWHYVNLEEEAYEIMKDTEKKVTAITEYGFYFLNAVGSVYVMIPFVGSAYRGGGTFADLLAVEALHDEPWIYFEFFSSLIVVYTCTNSAAHIACIFVAVTSTGIAQLRLAAISILSVDRRISSLTDERNIDIEKDKFLYQKLASDEIKSCAMHYQSIYRQTMKMFKSFAMLANFIYYAGLLPIICLGVMIIKRGENLVLLTQTSAAVLGYQYCLSYASESVMEEVEKFRLTVYSADWYNLPFPSQKNIHIMLTMLMFPPKMTTVFGATISSEFFSKLLNAGYYYITTILSMDIK